MWEQLGGPANNWGAQLSIRIGGDSSQLFCRMYDDESGHTAANNPASESYVVDTGETGSPAVAPGSSPGKSKPVAKYGEVPQALSTA